MLALFGLQHHNLVLIFSLISHSDLMPLLLDMPCIHLAYLRLVEINLPLLFIRPVTFAGVLLHLSQLLFVVQFFPSVAFVDLLSLEFHVHLADFLRRLRLVCRDAMAVTPLLLLSCKVVESFRNIGLLLFVTGHLDLIIMLTFQLPQLIVEVVLLLMLVRVMFCEGGRAQTRL